VGWLLQTDPNRRPSIEQVLTHPAILNKVQEFQMLYPASLPTRPKQRFGQPQKSPILPVNDKRVSIVKEKKKKINMRPSLNQKSMSSVNQGKERHVGNEVVMEKKKENLPGSMGQLNNAQKREGKVSLKEINEIKKETRGGKKVETPRPSVGVEVGKREVETREVISSKCFMKKSENEGKAEISNVNAHEEMKNKNLDINESISSRKERINQLLSRYGKNKDGKGKEEN
jgi:hypothetical protein